MKKLTASIAVLVLMAFILVPSAGAVLYDWSYTNSGGNVLSGFLEGTPVGGTSVEVTALYSVYLDSVEQITDGGWATMSLDDYLDGPPYTPAILSTDGSVMDFTAADAADAPPEADPAFWISLTGYSSLGFDVNSTFGFNETSFTEGVWAMEPIPEPATMLLLGSGLIGLSGFRRKFKK